MFQNQVDYKQITEDLQLKGYSKIDNFLNEEFYLKLKKEIFELEKTMKEEASHEIDSETGEKIIIDKNPILAKKINILDKDSENCKKYIQNLSIEFSKNLKFLNLKPEEENELDFNKIACCCGENINLPKHFDNGGNKLKIESKFKF